MKQSLKQAVNQHLGEVELSSAQVRELTHLAGYQTSTLSADRGWLMGGVVAVAALLAVLLFAPAANNGDSLQSIAEEVALNHLQLKPLEVRGDDLAQVRAYFTKLDFALRHTRLMDAFGHQLLGGRYCSILGKTAAQLRTRDNDGEDQTLYQVPYDSSRHGTVPSIERGEVPQMRYARGIGVRIWQEKGLLFALTGDAPPRSQD